MLSEAFSIWVREEFVDARFEKGVPDVSFAAIMAFSSDISLWVSVGISRRVGFRKLPGEGKSPIQWKGKRKKRE